MSTNNTKNIQLIGSCSSPKKCLLYRKSYFIYFVWPFIHLAICQKKVGLGGEKVVLQNMGQNESEAQTQNEIIHEPFLICEADAVYLLLKTKNDFKGNVNLLDSFNHVCYYVLVTQNQIEMLIPILECGLSRARISPNSGIKIEFKVDVVFKDNVIKPNNVVIKGECQYQKSQTLNRPRHVIQFSENGIK